MRFAGERPGLPMLPPGKPPPRGFPWMKVLLGVAGAIIVLFAVAAGLLFALGGDEDTVPADPTEPSTPSAVSTATSRPPATGAASAVATTVPSPTASPTATPSPVPPSPTPTLVPLPTATPTPAGPPLVRTRYVVQSGDACEVIRQR